MKRLTLLLALVLLPTQALAECAWVLWEESEYFDAAAIPVQRKEWTLHVARQTRGECEDVLTSVWQVALKHSQPGPDRPGIKDVKSGPGLIIVNFRAGTSLSRTFRCLPDTIDPRGKKD